MKKIVILFAVVMCHYFVVKAYSPYADRVLEMLPAPGQFVNVLPKADADDTPDSIAKKATTAIAGKASGSILHLGTFGGYVIVGFDHPIVNVPGEYDFQVNGNGSTNSSAEPGIVSVAVDANHNGIADDPWYEIVGSEYYKPETKHHYSVTYYRPTTEELLATGNIDNYIPWKDNQGNEGYVAKNNYHKQSYWPTWMDDHDSLTFYGSRLAENGTKRDPDNPNSPYWNQTSYDWGYVDNKSNGGDDSKFNIDLAVDDDGNHVDLPLIDFIKVHTGVLQMCGWLGETSTEVVGFIDLHPEESEHVNIPIVEKKPEAWFNSLVRSSLYIWMEETRNCQMISLTGRVVTSFVANAGSNAIALDGIDSGIYLLKIEGVGTYKIVKQ